MIKKSYTIRHIFVLAFILSIFLISTVNGQDYTLIPDQNFEKALFDLGLDDEDNDGRVLTDNISSITTLNIINSDIDSLTGIEDFIALTSLNCSYNSLEKLDLSSNTELKSINFSSNQISSVSLSANTELTSLICAYNRLDTLIVKDNILLNELDCSGNKLKKLDISSNNQLTRLICSSNQIDTLLVDALVDLDALDCSGNRIIELDVTQNIILHTLLCSNNQLKAIDVSANDSLTYLACSSNQLTSLDVSANRFLENLTCSSNQISGLNLSANDSLIFLSFANNQITTLDISQNLELVNLIGSSNLITGIDVSFNLLLERIDLSDNMLTDLTISVNDSLSSLNCSSNQLQNLNLANGQNAILQIFNSTDNPDLRCILVDNPAEAETYPDWDKDDIALYNTVCISRTYIPDDSFESALAAFDDIPDDNFIPTDSIVGILKLNIVGLGISDLTGIEDFLGLDTLICTSNLLVNLDMSMQANLKYLDCSFNLLEDLVIDNRLAGVLVDMIATDNPLLRCIKVDNIISALNEPGWLIDTTAYYDNNCTANKTNVPDDNFEQRLIDLGYDKGSLDNYVLSSEIDSVRSLDVSGLNILDLTGIEHFLLLDTLDCSSNSLSILNVSTLDSLKELNCYSNNLISLDLSANLLLESLSCGDNELSTLDLSLNTGLLNLQCDANNLTEIDLAANTELLSLNVSSNYITSSGLNLAANTKLKQLYCSSNLISSIDISNNPDMEVLSCSGNNISEIDLLGNPDLQKLDCSLNFLTSLDVGNNILLEEINCNSNMITELILSTNSLLEVIRCEDNEIDELNINSNGALLEVSVASNNLVLLNTSLNPLLREMKCNDNRITNLDLSLNDSLRIVQCEKNQLTNLDVSTSLRLNNLDIDNNDITTLNVSANDSLMDLSFADNLVETLEISSNGKLRTLILNNNNISVLNTDSNIDLLLLSVSGNKLESLDISNNIDLFSLSAMQNMLVALNMKNGNNSNISSLNVTGNPGLICIEVDDTAYANTAEGWQKDSFSEYSLFCHYDDTYIPDNDFEQALINLGYDTGPLDSYVPTDVIEVITSLDISGMGIVDITGINDFEALLSLDCSSNLLDTIDISKLISLTFLDCSNNQLNEIDLSNNTALILTDLSSNNITELDLSDQVDLESLICNSNDLTLLNLNGNAKLTDISLISNQLISLNLRNGNNNIITLFNVTGNAALECVEVDDPGYSDSAPGWQKDPTATYNINCHYGETWVPDDAFETILKDLGYDSSRTDPLDDYVPTSRISNIITLDISGAGISDLTGIEDFTSLSYLNCNSNALSQLYISNNISLAELNCSGNQLTGIDLSANTMLTSLNITNNQLATLDISSNILLSQLYCSQNSLVSLDIRSNNLLTIIRCYSNSLISLDANNGNNAGINIFEMNNNPDLRCILVDNVAAAEGYANWIKDIWSHYKTECNDDDNDGVQDIYDLCPLTPPGDEVDLFGCTIFVLPSNNFTIITSSETCRSSNDGKVLITAIEDYNYQASISGDNLDNVYSFTNDLEIRNLKAGNYQLCITITGIPQFSTCFVIVITEPEDLAVLSNIDLPGQSVTYDLSGGNSYSVTLNGLSITTAKDVLTLTLSEGYNSITIKADNECQGIFTETIFISREAICYPNPVKDYINIVIGDSEAEIVFVNIFSRTGRRMMSEKYPVSGGMIRFNISALTQGVYFVNLKYDDQDSTIEIIKK